MLLSMQLRTTLAESRFKAVYEIKKTPKFEDEVIRVLNLEVSWWGVGLLRLSDLLDYGIKPHAEVAGWGECYLLNIHVLDIFFFAKSG